MITKFLAFLLLAAAANAASTSQDITITITGSSSTFEAAGPSPALFAAPPYTCTANRYVSTTGSDSNNGTTPSTPWLTIARANSSVPAAGTCINLAAGTYNISSQLVIDHGGSTSSATGYVVYRSSTLGGAKIRASSVINGDMVRIFTGYVMFDGIEFDGNNNAVRDACFSAQNNSAYHHLWLLNSTLHHCGLGGVQLNGAEWFWVLHNLLYNNSSTSATFQGSGISFYEPVVAPSYTPTAMDNQWSPYRIIANYNIAHDNNGPQSGSGNTDGNGIIIDDWRWTQNSGANYTGPGLVMGNITYHNGGKGIHVFLSNGVTVANNTSYNNNWDTHNTGTWRSEISVQGSGTTTVVNNIAWAVPGSGVLANNTPYTGQQAISATNSWSKNIAFGAGNNFAAPDTYPVPANKVNTNPLLIDAPSNNFALQGASPAIGFGQNVTYWPQTLPNVDVGACVHQLTVCP